MSQQMTSYLSNLDYMTAPSTFQQVQNGIPTGLVNQTDAQPQYMHDGRGLGAYTHVDVLYQAYFTAYLVLNTLSVPLNPGNPYAESKTKVGFGNFGRHTCDAPGRSGHSSAQRRLVSEVVRASAPQARIRRRHCPFDCDRSGRHYSGQAEQQRDELERAAGKFQQIRQLLPLAGFSRRLPHAPRLSDRMERLVAHVSLF